jgi:hypothetical protein
MQQYPAIMLLGNIGTIVAAMKVVQEASRFTGNVLPLQGVDASVE